MTNEIYFFLTIPDKLSQEEKDAIYALARITKQFGSNVVNSMSNLFINICSWINHSLNVGKCASNLATGLENVDSNSTYVFGLLHDIGRKFKTDMIHTIAGYEYLVEKGYSNEAIVCLIHSHIYGERCANNEPAVPGWRCVNGESIWDNTVETDDLTKFLQQHQYTVYDLILNIADLMATDKSIMPVYDRVQDMLK